MKIHKRLITFYKKSKELEAARLKLKELKKTAIKINKNKTPDLSEIQDAIDHYMETKALSDIMHKIPSDLLGIQTKTLTVLRDIGLPAKTVIRVNDEHYGNIVFWYEGSNLRFKEENKDL
ncbi:hypothetical protein [Pedobacter psychrodurus]|uniref:hypothetical protein n=1 Tax=Pedobacter psychrodurus TaxID=2530456 RepID=UPI00293107A5|nr:hypothetical protein [Pedobacter psychrodurus]